MKLKLFRHIVGISIAALFFSCKHIDVYEKNVNIPKSEWSYNFSPSYTFNIADTTVDYNIYVVVRHRDAYNYNNIWIDMGTKPPADTIHHQKLDIQLGDDEQGWYGTGLDDIWEYRKIISRGPYRFRKAGEYNFTISQIMRENPLPGILSVGIRIEKVR